jgi:ComF family protein
VPLHRRRLAKRGFNQSLFLAKYAAEGLSIPLSLDGLVRVRDTRPQVDLDPAEREENVKGAFAVERPEEFKDKRVLLLDDVYTTGATVRECAKVIKKAGADAVYVLTVARAV